MSRAKKPFQQYSLALEDGRHVVQLRCGDEVNTYAWLVAESKSEALRRVRELGISNVHVITYTRPIWTAARAAEGDPDGGVFVRDPRSVDVQKFLPLAGLVDFLNGSGPPY